MDKSYIEPINTIGKDDIDILESIEDINFVCYKCKSNIEFSFNEEKIEINYHCSNCETNGEGDQSIPFRIYLEKMKEYYNKDNSCSECNKINGKINFCLICKKNVCEKCKEKHINKQGKCNKFSIINIDNKSNLCIEHSRKNSYYCKTCNEMICPECEKEKHDENDHHLINMEEKYNKMSKEYKDEFLNYIKNIENDKEKISQEEEQSMNSLKNELNEKIKQNKEKGDKSLEEIDMKKQVELDKANQTFEKQKKDNETFLQSEINKIIIKYQEKNNQYQNEYLNKNNNINETYKEKKEKKNKEIQKEEESLNLEYNKKISNIQLNFKKQRQHKDDLINIYQIFKKGSKNNKENYYIFNSFYNILKEIKQKNEIHRMTKILNDKNIIANKTYICTNIVNDSGNYTDAKDNTFLAFESINQEPFLIYANKENRIIYLKSNNKPEILSEKENNIIEFRHYSDNKNKKDLILLICDKGQTLKFWSWDGKKWSKPSKIPFDDKILSACFINKNENIYILISSEGNNPIKLFDLNSKQIKMYDNIKKKAFYIDVYYGNNDNEEEQGKLYIIMGNEDFCRSYIFDDNLNLNLYKEYKNQNKVDSPISYFSVKYNNNNTTLIACCPEAQRIKKFDFHKNTETRLKFGKELIDNTQNQNKDELITPKSFCQLNNNNLLLVSQNDNIIRLVDQQKENISEMLVYHTSPVVSIKKIDLGNSEIIFSQGKDNKINKLEINKSGIFEH